jgi:hypothetical protein
VKFEKIVSPKSLSTPNLPPQVRNNDTAVSFTFKPGTTLSALKRKCKGYKFIEIEDCEKVTFIQLFYGVKKFIFRCSKNIPSHLSTSKELIN